MRNVLLIFCILSVVIFSCGESSQSKNKTVPAPTTKVDDYAVLQENSLPNNITDDLSGKVQIISEEEFTKLVTGLKNPKGFQYLGTTPCIVDLYADWCRPCISMNSLYSELAEEFKGKVIFYKVNVDKAPNITNAFKARSIPMFLYFKPHSNVTKTLGAVSKDELRQHINTILLNQ